MSAKKDCTMKSSLIDDCGNLVKYLDWRPGAEHIAGRVKSAEDNVQKSIIIDFKKGGVLKIVP